MSWSRRNAYPVLMLEVNGQDASDLLRYVTSFEHKASISKAAITTWQLRNVTGRLMEDPRLFPNTKWKFRYGYFNDLSPVTEGLIREVAPVYAAGRTVSLKLYDASSTLTQTSSGKVWGTVPSSAIAQQIAKKHGMKFVGENSKDRPKKAFIQPEGVNDMQFLRDIAADIAFEVFVDGSPPTLYYRAKPYGSVPARRLTYFSDPSNSAYVLSFTPKVKDLGPLNSGASKAGKDGKTDADKAKATGGGESGLGDGDIYLGRQRNPNTGAVEDVLVVGKDVHSIGEGEDAQLLLDDARAALLEDGITKPAPTEANTTGIAKAHRSHMLDKANEASSEHPLTASLRCGFLYEWAGVEKQLGGLWYADEVTYKITGTTTGTSVTWKRNYPNDGKKKGDTNNKRAGDTEVTTGTMRDGEDSGYADVVIVGNDVHVITPGEDIELFAEEANLNVNSLDG